MPKHSGIYFVKDNIINLQFKIHVRSINTLLKLPKYTVSENISSNLSIPEKRIKNPLPDDEKIVLIKWQQKLFSLTECELFSDIKNCTNDQQRKYYEMIKEKDRAKKHTKKKGQRKQAKAEVDTNFVCNFIFTYVNEDNFVPNINQDKNLTGKIKYHGENSFEEMFVYAALKPDTQLAVLRWFKEERLLYIYPDFTDSESQPYFIEIDSDYRHLYSYSIEDVSPKGLTSCGQEQFLFLPELPTHWRLEDDLSKNFAMPPKRTQRCAIIFTIKNLSGFEYDNIHVRYHIQLPENIILEEGILDATSHSASSCDSNSNQYIALTWQITVLCKEQFKPSQHLRIFFEIISIDSWERERIEGFSNYSLNLLQPCHHTVKLSCIRPVETFFETLNRYFIGGRRKFDYQNFVCEQAKDKEENNITNFHCRYGERMQNSGQLSLSCQVLTQRNCELLNPCSNRTSGMTLDDIMMAYKEARRRLEAVSFN